MTDVKRPAENGSAGGELVKRQKTENGAIVPGRAQQAEVHPVPLKNIASADIESLSSWSDTCRDQRGHQISMLPPCS